MRRFIDDVNTAFDNNNKQNLVDHLMADIQVMFRICIKADNLFKEDETEFFYSLVNDLSYKVSNYRHSIEDYVNKKISEVSDTQTE